MGHEIEKGLSKDISILTHEWKEQRMKIMNKKKWEKKIYRTRFLKNLDILIGIQLRRDNGEEDINKGFKTR